MIKKLLLGATLLASTVAPAFAGTMIAVPGFGPNGTGNFAAPVAPGSVLFDFNSAAVPTGFSATYTNASLLTGDSTLGAEPAFSDHSQYLSVQTNGAATIQSSNAYEYVSFFIGSIDTYNKVEILSTTGAVIATYFGGDFTTPLPANGDQDIMFTNRRVTFTRDAADAFIGGVRFSSTNLSAEVDNLVFAVPEPSTWMLMLTGFGMIGYSMRSRRKRTNVVFA